MRLSGFASVVLAIKTVERIVSWSTKQTNNESVYSATVFLWLSSELLRIFTSNALCKYFFRAFLADHVESVLAFHIVCRQTPDISYWNKNAYIFFFSSVEVCRTTSSGSACCGNWWNPQFTNRRLDERYVYIVTVAFHRCPVDDASVVRYGDQCV